MRLIEDLPELFKISIIRMDVFVVRNVIAVIGIGRRKDRTEPDAVHSQLLYVFKPVINTVEITDPVVVAVRKGAYPDLVKRHFTKIKLLTAVHETPVLW